MLTKEQALLEFDFQRQTVTPDRLHRKTHDHYLPLAEALLQIYRDHVGADRKSVHEQVRRKLQSVADCPTRRISAFCKLLDDASEYHRDQAGNAAKLRQRVFAMAATKHPLVQRGEALFDQDEVTVKAEIATQLGRDWTDIETQLFADVIEFHRLIKAPTELHAAGLLSRYNVAQTQAAMYRATAMTVWAKQDFKTILRYAKLARLMHSITRRGDEYVFQFNGPASVVRQTKRYGIAFAKFLPGLLAARHWHMQATIIGPAQYRFALRLKDSDGLRSEIEIEEFDSQLEALFAAAWQATDTNGWTLSREATVLHQGQTVFMPDFTMTHEQHGEVLLEVIGFWTPEYLREKAVRLERFRNQARIILAIAESAQDAIPDLGMPRVTFKTKLHPQRVLEQLAIGTAET